MELRHKLFPFPLAKTNGNCLLVNCLLKGTIMLYPITSVRPTATNENQILLAYHPRNGKDVPESERKVSQFCVLPIPRIDGLLPASIEYRFIMQAVVSQAKALLEDACKSGITELPAFTLEDLLESVNESADGIGRLSKDKINEFIKLHGISAKAAAVMAEKNSLAADHPAVIKIGRAHV